MLLIFFEVFAEVGEREAGEGESWTDGTALTRGVGGSSSMTEGDVWVSHGKLKVGEAIPKPTFRLFSIS
jgi:hypothetical protein